ncbi:TKL family protein kinase [Histomonas meleagridis]|uniref:TKL family protein kinase n=1 Tax=Histomonas meleagridis TaxID=135588 RepID=UPI00355ABAFB|nr:TKL family protein kinase [Histomonas meleagridis]KAH0796194.1 TKL family protein kinase [Histomonas meleagridis]
MQTSLSFGKWIQHVQYEIRNLTKSTKQMVVHRVLLTFICNQFHSFSKLLRSRENDETDLDKTQEELFKQMINVINSLKELFEQQYESTWLQFFLDHPLDYTETEVTRLSQLFNDISSKLGLGDTPISFTETQFKTEVVHDLGIIQQLLENSNIPGLESKINEIVQHRNQLAKDAGIDSESKKPKALELSVIKESLMSFEKWEISPDDLVLQKKIGSGGFAEVFLGYLKSDGTIVAVKKLHHQQFDEHMLEMFKREVAICARLKHFAILPFVGACTKPPFCIVTEFMSGGSLFSRLHAKEASDRLSPTQLSIIALGIAYGMKYLHEQQMLHRDLKSLNILLDADNFPKISDFGMASTKSSNSETVGIGTSQWMAPEVLNSQRYDEKSDVYSYGIVLWEMLTGDVPYRGLRDIQVAMTVINQNNRPKIPKNCPHNLAKFIRICWHTDPDKRPDFKTIVRALESCTITFPGTDLEKYKNYIQQFGSPSFNNDEFVNDLRPFGIDPNSITEEQIGKIIEECEQDETAITKLTTLISNQDIVSMIAQFDIIPFIVKHLETSNDQHIIATLVSLLEKLLKDESMVASFIENNGDIALLNVLTRFVTTTIPKLLSCLIAIVGSQRCIFSQQHISRISSFLLASDVVVRKKAINLLDQIIDHEFYEDESIFSTVVENLLRNAIPESNSELLLATLNLLIKIASFEGAKAQIRCVDGADRICILLENEDSNILVTALRLLQILFDGIMSKQRTISIFLSQFTSLLQRADFDVQLEALNALTMLMDNILVYKEVYATKNFALCLTKCIQSEDIIVQVSALRICFAFCSNSITVNKFQILLKTLLNLLKSSTYSAILSAYSIAALLAENDIIEEINLNECEQLKTFLIDALSLESELTAPAIRLVGVLASNMNYVNLLEKWSLMTYIVQLLKSKNEELTHLALMALTALSAALPDSTVMIDAIPLLFNACYDYSFSSYPFICLSNITVDPINAKACIEYLPQLFKHFTNEDPVAVQRAIVTACRIASLPEAKEILKKKDVIDQFFVGVKDMWESEHAPILFNMIETMSATPEVCKLLKENNMLNVIEKKLASSQLNDSNRPKYIRIRAMLRKCE